MAEFMPQDAGQWNWKELFCLFCWPPCPRAIASKLAFMPPQSTYRFKQDDRKEYTIWPNIASVCLATVPTYHTTQSKLDCFFARTTKGNNIACVHVKCREKPAFTILFSHGNAVDVGQILDFYKELAASLRCNIVLYDYSGFGESTGKASEKNMYADIDAVWQHLRQRLGVPPDRAVLFGQSIGTVPTVDLAARQAVAGVVLQSPLTSGMRLVFPNWRRARPFDVFNNVSKAHLIASPVLVMHGTEDTIIDVSHGLEMHSRCANTVSPLWLRGAGHNNLEMYPQYLERLQAFFNRDLAK